MTLSETLYNHFEGKAPSLSEFINWISDNYETVIQDFADKHPVKRAAEIATDLTHNYNTFLQTPLSLEMLVPCKDGEPMEEPMHHSNGQKDLLEVQAYQQAKERCIFTGFEMEFDNHALQNNETKCLVWVKSSKSAYDYWIRKTISDMVGQPITENYFKTISK